MLNTLIVGATGLVGSALVKACTEVGQSVHVLVRPERSGDPDIRALQGTDVVIHAAALDDADALRRACRAADVVISALDVTQVDETPIVSAAREARVQRFVPSGFGVNPAKTPAGISLVYDIKRSMQAKILAAGLDFTFVHANGFFTHWVDTLGDMFRLTGATPPDTVTIYGEGDVSAAVASVPDIAAVVARAVADSSLRNREIDISPIRITQNELLDAWHAVGGRDLERRRMGEDEVLRRIEIAKREGEDATLPLLQLHQSMWIRGDSARPDMSVDARSAYPDIVFQTIAERFEALTASESGSGD